MLLTSCLQVIISNIRAALLARVSQRHSSSWQSDSSSGKSSHRSLACTSLLRFDSAFHIKKDYKAIHTSNCDACEIIVESNAISSI